jgi:hypothetical protein
LAFTRKDGRKSQKNIGQGSQCHDRDSNRAPPKMQTRSVTARANLGQCKYKESYLMSGRYNAPDNSESEQARGSHH